MKLGMYIMAPEPFSTAYFMNPSHQSACLYVHPPVVARQRFGKYPPIFRNVVLQRHIVYKTMFYYVSPCTPIVARQRLG
jgi:hypothetical protein